MVFLVVFVVKFVVVFVFFGGLKLVISGFKLVVFVVGGDVFGFFWF